MTSDRTDDRDQQPLPPEWPALTTTDATIGEAFEIALDDLASNIGPWKGELATQATQCILAGGSYDKPWTRDASLNSWYAGNLFIPTISKNTLLSVLTDDEFGLRIGGQYWDAIIWVTAAWDHFLCTRDPVFLEVAFEASVNSMRYFELTERDDRDGLFRGGACFQDGISGYPDQFIDGPTSGILDWPKRTGASTAISGEGLPMKALSTNCLYFAAYEKLQRMAEQLQSNEGTDWAIRAERLRANINKRFWNPVAGSYRYLVDVEDTVDRQEGFGNAFAILFGVATPEQAQSVLRRQAVTPHGIPCLWPNYDRYRSEDGQSFGRHSGVVWPQVNAVWALAAVSQDRRDLAWSELRSLAAKAIRDGQFVETYHPVSGLPYGGVQEPFNRTTGPIEWPVRERQTWCATGFIGMVLTSIVGVSVDENGVSLAPQLPPAMDGFSLTGVSYANCTFDVHVVRSAATGSGVSRAERAVAHLPPDSVGHRIIELVIAERTTGSRVSVFEGDRGEQSREVIPTRAAD